MNRIKLSRKKCIGCALCSDHLPEMFAVDEHDGKVYLRNVPVIEVQQTTHIYVSVPEIEYVVRNCPVHAITRE